MKQFPDARASQDDKWGRDRPCASMRAPRRWLIATALSGIAAAALAQGSSAPELLPGERAFAFSARGVDSRTIEVHFAVAPGYYLYRDKIRFTVEPDMLAADPALPAGQIKHDAFFGAVATLRGEIAVRLPLRAASPGRPVTVTAESQGCADVGVCYPPQRQQLTLALPATGAGPGATVDALPPKTKWFN